MQINIIAAVADNGVIGHQGSIPWNIPEDMARFKRLTEGHTVIMGRKTWEGLPKKPLPNRHNYILTSSYIRNLPDSDWGMGQYKSLDLALHMAKALGQTQVFLIGGTQVFQEALDKGLVDVLYLTVVHSCPAGDTLFPNFNNDWKLEEKVERGNYDFVTFKRGSNGTNKLADSNIRPSNGN